MANLFEKGFNKFADMGNAMNRGINKLAGKEIVGEIKKFEEPKTFAPFSSYPQYSIPEPEQWQPLCGEEKTFTLHDNNITFSKNLDICLKYGDLFKSSARYYTDRFVFKYKNCVHDYDSMIFYFNDMYLEGLIPMITRAQSLLLLFDIFNINIETFFNFHVQKYNKAFADYDFLITEVENRNQSANNIGNKVGNSVKFYGGGFGIKGALKGTAKAGILNMGMNSAGKYVSNQLKLSDKEKNDWFYTFNTSIFFSKVYSDYVYTFFSLIELLVQNNVLSEIATLADEEYHTMINNINNPMFPQDKMIPLIIRIIKKYPFTYDVYTIYKNKFGENEELTSIYNYLFV